MEQVSCLFLRMMQDVSYQRKIEGFRLRTKNTPDYWYKVPQSLNNLYLTNREDAKNAKEDGEEDS
ncbi:hypothetical protein D0A37_20690 [Microcoleus vaginatus HSN003]|nr:hypothetical protein D0A37_20690 [Microcoleus vaginatus HSN003]